MSLPPVEVPQGAIRFNTDSQKLEFYAQDQWWIMASENVGLGTGGDTGAGARGLFGGGYVSPGGNVTRIDQINISSAGNAINFGDLSQARRSTGCLASSTRAVWAGGANTPTVGTKIDFVTISSTGTATDFGASLSQARRNTAGCSNATRGVFAGGNTDASPAIFFNIIEYITIATTGSVLNFGTLTQQKSAAGAVSSPTRGVFAGGLAPTAANVIDYITISTLGSATDFGDLTANTSHLAGCSNAVRGLFGGGYAPNSSSTTSAITYITISTLGNSVNFGSLTTARPFIASSSSPTRGVWAGGYNPLTNVIDYVTIATQGNAVDFGDTTAAARGQLGGCSNAHGGL